jgi:hypothetical protein
LGQLDGTTASSGSDSDGGDDPSLWEGVWGLSPTPTHMTPPPPRRTSLILHTSLDQLDGAAMDSDGDTDHDEDLEAGSRPVTGTVAEPRPTQREMLSWPTQGEMQRGGAAGSATPGLRTGSSFQRTVGDSRRSRWANADALSTRIKRDVSGYGNSTGVALD